MDGLAPAAIAVAVATIESLVEISISFRLPDGAINRKLIYTLIAGVAVALVIPAFDIYKAAGITVFPPIAGRILSGLLATRGANLFHDFLGIVEASKLRLKNVATPLPASASTNQAQ